MMETTTKQTRTQGTTWTTLTAAARWRRHRGRRGLRRDNARWRALIAAAPRRGMRGAGVRGRAGHALRNGDEGRLKGQGRGGLGLDCR